MTRRDAAAKGAELDSAADSSWCIYNIVESESDPLTRRPVDLFEKEPLKGKWKVNLCHKLRVALSEIRPLNFQTAFNIYICTFS